MINCREIREQTPSYLDGDVPFGQRLSIWMHLAMCRVCSTYVRQIRIIRDRLGNLPGISPRRDLREESRRKFNRSQA